MEEEMYLSSETKHKIKVESNYKENRDAREFAQRQRLEYEKLNLI